VPARVPFTALVHPRRLWLWIRYRPEIEAGAKLLLPSAYSIKESLQTKSPDFERIAQLAAKATLADKTMSLTPNPKASVSREGMVDLGLAGADAFALYGGADLLAQLDLGHSQIVGAAFTAMSGAISNAANLGAARAVVENFLQNVPSALHPFVTPIVSGCLQQAEQHCMALFPRVEHVSAGHVASDGLSLLDHARAVDSASGIGHLDPNDSIAVTPTEAVNSHLADHGMHAETLGGIAADHAGDSAGSNLLDHTVHHLPWFTLARSSYREINLLRSGKTDLLTSVKHVGTDTVSMAAGAKIGAGIGSVVPVVGTLFGAIAGGILGRFVGNEFKQRSLKAAVGAYEGQLKVLKDAEEQQERRTTEEFTKVRDEQQYLLGQVSDRNLQTARRSAESLGNWISAQSQMPTKELRQILEEASRDLANCLRQLEDRTRHDPLAHFFWPDVATESRKVASSQLRQRERDIALLHLRAAEEGGLPVGMMFSVLAAYGVAQAKVDAYIAAVQVEREKRQREFEDQLERSHTTVLQTRYESVARLNELLKSLANEAAKAVEPLMEKLRAFEQDLLRERGKLGLG
jgi:outer membrane lipoprotein SlyB